MAACIAWRWNIIWTVCSWYGCLHCLEVGYYLNCLPMACLLALLGGGAWSELFPHGMFACIAWRWDIIWMVCSWHGCLHCLEVGLWSELFPHGMSACIAWKWDIIWMVCLCHGCLHCLEVGYDLNCFPMACLLALPGRGILSEWFAHGMAACIAWKQGMI